MKRGAFSSRGKIQPEVKDMFAKKILLLVAALMLSSSAVFAKAAPRRDKNPPEKREVRIPLSAETRRFAAECRRDPSDEKREELKRQVRRDYDRFISELRNKPKTRGHRRDQHRFNEMIINERDKRIEKIVDRLINGPPENDKKPAPPHRKR